MQKNIKKLLLTLATSLLIFLASAVWYPMNQYQPSSKADDISAKINMETSENSGKKPLFADNHTVVDFEETKQTLEQSSSPEEDSLENLYGKQDGNIAADAIQKAKDTSTNQTANPAERQFLTASHGDLQKAALNQDRSTAKSLSSETSSSTSAPLNATNESSGSIDDPLLDIWFKQIEKSKKPPNIFFIIADDMRPDIGFYNKYFSQTGSTWLNQKMHTPFLDGLAAQSLVFSRAYSQQAWCNPSRSSFLTSRRPDTTMVHNNTVYFRENNPNFVTLPQFFKNKGYFTAAYGKVFHRLNVPGDSDDAYSWSQPARGVRKGKFYPEPPGIKAVPEKDLEESQLTDQIMATEVMGFLDNFSGRTNTAPFFLTLGLRKPHLPFVFPERFLGRYPLSNITMPPNPTAAKNMPPVAWFKSFEFRGSQNLKPYAEVWTSENALPNQVIKTVRQGYYACISYIDELIGKVLTKLESSGFGNNTIVVFIGDHGYHLGEQSIMGKNTAFEVAANAPMMIRIPGVTDKGIRTEKLAEFVDIFPTLVELAGFRKLSTCPESTSRSIDLCTEGLSLVPLFRTTMPANFKWKESVFYQYPHYPGKGNNQCMGYTIRTGQYRFTEWTPYLYKDQSSPLVNRTTLCGVELYDHLKDPNETINIADSTAFSAIVSQLSAKLREGWTRSIPNLMPASI